MLCDAVAVVCNQACSHLTIIISKWGVNFSVGEDDVAKLLKDVGVAADKAAIKAMIEKLAGKSIPDLVRSGRTQFASMPAGGGGAPASSAPATAKKEEPKKEEPKKEEEVDVDMGDLFGY